MEVVARKVARLDFRRLLDSLSPPPWLEVRRVARRMMMLKRRKDRRQGRNDRGQTTRTAPPALRSVVAPVIDRRVRRR